MAFYSVLHKSLKSNKNPWIVEFLFVLITSKPILDSFWGSGQIKKSKMADQDGHHSEMIMQLLRHVASWPHDVDIKRNIDRRTA